MSPHLSPLLRRIETRAAVVGVMGLGYVGLPLARLFAERGFLARGFDSDPAKLATLAAGGSYLKHIPADSLAPLVAAGRLLPSPDPAALALCDAIAICVPTPLDAARQPDLSFVVATGEAIAAHLRPGQLVVLESTTYPGTTAELLQPLLERDGLKAGRDFFLAFSPEREDPGNAQHGTADIPKVVGADDAASRQAVAALYGAVVPRVVPVSSSATAEAVKLTENVFRAVNIALVNELKVIYEALGIDVWEVIEAAKTKPFGFMPFYPGPGLGGHCIPIDPFYLSWKARQAGVEAAFVELAGLVNRAMPDRVVAKLAAALAPRGLAGAGVLIVGLAYKKNVDDTRESPALALIERIEAAGGVCTYHDPWVPRLPKTREHAALAGRLSQPLDAATLAGVDAVLIATDHDAVDYALIGRAAPLVIDTRNAMARVTAPRAKVIKA